MQRLAPVACTKNKIVFNQHRIEIGILGMQEDPACWQVVYKFVRMQSPAPALCDRSFVAMFLSADSCAFRPPGKLAVFLIRDGSRQGL